MLFCMASSFVAFPSSVSMLFSSLSEPESSSILSSFLPEPGFVSSSSFKSELSFSPSGFSSVCSLSFKLSSSRFSSVCFSSSCLFSPSFVSKLSSSESSSTFSAPVSTPIFSAQTQFVPEPIKLTTSSIAKILLFISAPSSTSLLYFRQTSSVFSFLLYFVFHIWRYKKVHDIIYFPALRYHELFSHQQTTNTSFSTAFVKIVPLPSMFLICISFNESIFTVKWCTSVK